MPHSIKWFLLASFTFLILGCSSPQPKPMKYVTWDERGVTITDAPEKDKQYNWEPEERIDFKNTNR